MLACFAICCGSHIFPLVTLFMYATESVHFTSPFMGRCNVAHSNIVWDSNSDSCPNLCKKFFLVLGLRHWVHSVHYQSIWAGRGLQNNGAKLHYARERCSCAGFENTELCMENWVYILNRESSDLFRAIANNSCSPQADQQQPHLALTWTVKRVWSFL